ncbi:catalase/peroxidase HPI [Tsukamurella strandjordii]|uniref:Catalase-peroxidase n=1 Tax=Tsukamurella strandjordii TaxID=147577 RepID=A0AA90N812_9ACTN|nr:catalase/peroxidase HPI [Tsukamurella strandjordii]MDP0397261.1 catalase/peroxidase HPI [Tsukamurella strandjordii]
MSEEQTPFPQSESGGCPVAHGSLRPPVAGGDNRDWWPDEINLRVLAHNPVEGNPMGADFDYAAEVATLDVDALKADLIQVMHTSQDWWPADFGHYGPLFIRMSWHSAGTYRTEDGRGGGGAGMQRFAPLNSWPDNVSLDKSRRLLWPIKQKYGRKLSWADLLVFAGNVALEDMGFKTAGFAFGRTDEWEPQDVYWGPEHEWLGTDGRYTGKRDLEQPLGASTMGLIYVNPEGPEGVPDYLAAATDIRETFGRMAMNDVETAALIVGGHTFGKTHGAGPVENGPEPEAAPIKQQGFGWKGGNGTGVGPDAVTSGIEVTWTHTPTKWDNSFLEILYGNEWELTKSPAGAHQWKPKDNGWANSVPDAFGTGKTHPSMLTTDLTMRFDPIYGEITKRWLEHPEELAEEFAKAWFKLLHRDMGPVSRYVGPLVPATTELWQDPVPAVDHPLIDDADAEAIKQRVLETGLSSSRLIKTAWAAFASFRDSDKRGGANGGRLRLQPQAGWEVNEPDELAQAVRAIEGVAQAFTAETGKKVSFADTLVLAGNAGIEKAAKDGGVTVSVPFTPGRTDASQEQTDIDSFSVLEPKWDAFRNFVAKGAPLPAEYLLVDKAEQLGLTAPEMTVLLGGLRVVGNNFGESAEGVLTDRPGALTNDFFVNLLDMSTKWAPASDDDSSYVGTDRATGTKKWTASRVDLVFGSNSILRALAEVYATDDAKEKFVNDFVATWTKVSNADRFDVKN